MSERRRLKVTSVFGTRPEAIKMATVVKALAASPDIDSRVVVTGQHKEMLDQVLQLFGITPDVDLAVMQRAQSLTHVTTAVLEGLGDVFGAEKPDWVFVHGDTTTTMAASLAAYYQQIPVGHVEAGLRTGNRYSPFPEEINRAVTGRIATAHFAPTESSRQNLLAENISDHDIVVTGNTVIDALYWVRDNLLTSELVLPVAERFSFLDPSKRLILVTGHRRESHDGGLEEMCQAVAELAARGDTQIVYPVHLNPKVQAAANHVLADVDDVYLVEPQDYLPFVWLMDRAHLIITDSGGVQEEAPALGVPVLVTRNTTERPEAVSAGTVKLVGTDKAAITASAHGLLDNTEEYEQMSSADSPYGDGHASKRIVSFLTDR
jgi:UDP-N-acetylglucosamine 2-epimerase (non-hydrolysing)